MLQKDLRSLKVTSISASHLRGNAVKKEVWVSG